MAIVLANLVNNISFMSGHFPTVMKEGIVVLLLKKSGLDVTDLKNFHPVTNLSTISKVPEHLALARLKPHIRASPNYCILQSAYRQGHSTETAMSKILDDIIGSIDMEFQFSSPSPMECSTYRRRASCHSTII